MQVESGDLVDAEVPVFAFAFPEKQRRGERLVLTDEAMRREVEHGRFGCGTLTAASVAPAPVRTSVPFASRAPTSAASRREPGSG